MADNPRAYNIFDLRGIAKRRLPKGLFEFVSNHGGRNLDNAMSPIEALPEVVDAVGNRITVLFDTGLAVAEG